jgi:glycosyltransferase involved in cell wall biosynthesis
MVDSIFFAYPDLLRELISGLSGKTCTLLVHWLPWLEEKLIEDDFREAGLPHLPPRKIGGDSLELLPLFDAFVATSCFSAGKLIERGIMEEKICTAVPGVEGSHKRIKKRFNHGKKRNDGRLQFVTAAHWTPVKGLHRLLPMLETVYRKLPCFAGPSAEQQRVSGRPFSDCVFLWHSIGSRKKETAYGKYLSGVTASGEITFPYRLHGALTPESSWELIASCDCVLVPSIFETYGMAAAESVALGIPVVGFDAGGLSEAVRDGSEGFLCSSKEDYMHVMERLLKNPSLLAGMKQTCYKKPVKEWKETAKTIYDFLAKL